jgi:hypothetical protein
VIEYITMKVKSMYKGGTIKKHPLKIHRSPSTAQIGATIRGGGVESINHNHYLPLILLITLLRYSKDGGIRRGGWDTVRPLNMIEIKKTRLLVSKLC